jgi:hypothetical protein
MRSGVAPAAVIGASSESWECLVILHEDRKIWVIHSRGNEREKDGWGKATHGHWD